MISYIGDVERHYETLKIDRDEKKYGRLRGKGLERISEVERILR